MPCTGCAANGRQCVYNELADKRRKVATKHTQEKSAHYRGLLGQLLRAIRLCERDTVDGIVDIIRNLNPEDDTLHAVAHCLSQCPVSKGVPDSQDVCAGVRDLGFDTWDQRILQEWESGVRH